VVLGTGGVWLNDVGRRANSFAAGGHAAPVGSKGGGRAVMPLSLAKYVARVAWSMPGAVVFRLPDVVRQFERVAWGGLPIAMVAGGSVGLVSWLQTRRLLAQFGAEATLPSLLTVAVLVETGPMLAGLLVAGRSGAGLAAELGGMCSSEELDAREVLGAATIPTLVAPRVLACMLALPVLTVALDASAVLGGLAGELAGGRLTALGFWQRSLLYVRLTDVIPATLKTGLFGLVVGLVSCWTGLRAGVGSESIGRAATRGVVRSTVAVFAANVAIVPLIQAGVAALGLRG